MPSLADYRWLMSDDGAKWLEETAGAGDSLVTLSRRLRERLSAERTHLVLEQVALRTRAREKFTGAAAAMFFTKRGYEQATDAVIAAYKAMRFPADRPLADLCCGIGGDLAALSRRGPVLGVDRDMVVTLFANANCGAPTKASAVVVADVAQQTVQPFAAWHLDPDRRPQGRRSVRVELHEPGVETVDRLLGEQPNGAVKLAPAAQWPDHWTQQAEMEWIERGGECRQLVAWFGSLAHRLGERAATVLTDAATPARTVRGVAGIELPSAPAIARYVFEPAAAVLAAGLAGSLAVSHSLAAITGAGGYLTGDRPLADEALACFEVLDTMPYHPRRIRELLRQRRIGRLEVKKRGVSVEPEQVRRELRVSGDESATLLLARVNGRVTAILARRM